MAGRRGLVSTGLGSGDRVRGFKSQPRQSGFSAGYFFSFNLSLREEMSRKKP